MSSHDSFDEDKKRWLFAIDSNKDYPHAIWWEKKGDGISKFNPSISLAAFITCYDNRTYLYDEIIKEGFEYLQNGGDISGDDINCYLLAYGSDTLNYEKIILPTIEENKTYTKTIVFLYSKSFNKKHKDIEEKIENIYIELKKLLKTASKNKEYDSSAADLFIKYFDDFVKNYKNTLEKPLKL